MVVIKMKHISKSVKPDASLEWFVSSHWPEVHEAWVPLNLPIRFKCGACTGIHIFALMHSSVSRKMELTFKIGASLWGALNGLSKSLTRLALWSAYIPDLPTLPCWICLRFIKPIKFVTKNLWLWWMDGVDVLPTYNVQMIFPSLSFIMFQVRKIVYMHAFRFIQKCLWDM